MTMEEVAEKIDALLSGSGLRFVVMLTSPDWKRYSLLFDDISHPRALKVAIDAALESHIEGKCKCKSHKRRFH